MNFGKMMIVLILVQFLFEPFQLLPTMVSAADCPLDLSSRGVISKEICNNPKKELEGIFLTECCAVALSIYTMALAVHTNETGGKTLFLAGDEESACDDLISEAINSSKCSFDPLVAGRSSCLFSDTGSLEQAFDIVNTKTPSNPLLPKGIIDACANLEAADGCKNCTDAFNAGQLRLSSGLDPPDEISTCNLALLIYVASHNTSDTRVEQLYSCLNVPLIITGHAEGTFKKKAAVLGTFLGLVIALAAFVAAIYFGKWYFRKVKDSGDGSEGEKSGEDISNSFSVYGGKLSHESQVVTEGSLYSFSSKELAKATDNFSSKNFVGEGSAGKVFKGVLPSGQLVAIKLINNEKKLETFFTEVESLSKVRHTNLVTLFGYCQTRNEHLLVYEYCSRGNLWYYLFGNGPVLTWEQRIHIALGSARGIWYLHLYPGGYIVHRDIKPTNILLNEHMEAKVSDFGLSRFIALDESCVFTEVKGTAGYLDPEYLSHGALTFASDVYSFGIVLLQLISARRPIDLDPIKRLSLVKMANHVLKDGGDLADLVDPRLQGCYSETAFRKITELAVQCTSEHGKMRPSMIQVLHTLEEAWRLARLESPSQRTPLRTSTQFPGLWSPQEEGQTIDHSWELTSRSTNPYDETAR